jgi:hypothetical protein
MKIAEAKQYVGHECSITFRRGNGSEVTRQMTVEDVAYVPLYGSYIIGDIEDICVDRITRIAELR